MKRLSFLYMLLILVGCTESAIEDNSIIETGVEEFYATIEGTDARTYVDEQIRMRWHAKDRITIFKKETYNREFEFTGKTGANAGGFKQVSVDDEFYAAPTVNANYAVYPHSADTELDETDCFFTLNMPAEQTYAENSFGLNANTMVAVSETGNLIFKNVGCYLRVRLHGENASISSVTLKTKGTEAIAGEAKVTPSMDGNPTCEMLGTGKSIRLTCETPVTISSNADSPTDFWIVVPPVTLASGFTVTIENADKKTQTYDVNKSFTFERNKYYDMVREVEIEDIPTIHVTQAGTLSSLISDEDKYTITSLKITGSLNGTDIVFVRDMAGVGSSVSASENHVIPTTNGRLIELDMSEATIVEGGSSYYELYNAETLSLASESDEGIGTSTRGVVKSAANTAYYTDNNVIGANMFRGCNLETIKLPNNTSSIGEYAFDNTNLSKVYCCIANPPTLASTAFPVNMTTSGTLFVPEAYKSIYSSAGNWSEFVKIEEEGEVTDVPNNDTYDGSVVRIVEAGTMKGLLGDEMLNVTSLKVVGSINGDDVRCLRQMLGSSGFTEKGKLTSLDLSEASIVEGGSWYCRLNEDLLEEKFCYTSNGVISEYMFYNLPNLQNLVLPTNITTIRYSAFEGASTLSSLKIPAGVTYIGQGAFSGCSSLVSIDIPNSVTVIDGLAVFSDCSSLVSIDIPDGVTSIGDSFFSGCSSLTSINIPAGVIYIGQGAFSGCSSLVSIDIPDGVTSIGDYSFSGCTSLNSIDVPAGVTYIGRNAFYGCSSLASIDIPDGVTSIGKYTFHGCTSLNSITISDGVTSIGEYAFYGCSSLNSINIPDGVTSIGEYAFHKCSSLKSIDMPGGVTSIGKYTFYGCTSLSSITIPDGVASIGEYTFYGCSSLSSIDIPDGVTSIGEYTFSGCSSLSSIDIPDGITSIGRRTFENCTALASATIGKGVTSIGGYTFHNCKSLTSIIIPDAVTSIGGYTFYGCSSLASVTIGKGVSSIVGGTFDGCTSLTDLTIGESVTTIDCSFSKSVTSVYITDLAAWCRIVFGSMYSNPLSYGAKLYLNKQELTELVIPEEITEIKDYAFYGCGSLIEVNIPQGVASVGRSAFYNCTALVSTTLEEGVTSIGVAAFRNCSSLASINIPSGVTSIGKQMFYGCSSLASIDIPDGVTSIGEYAFYGCLSLNSIDIPDGVASIDESTFQYCSSLTSATIGKGVTSIGKFTFWGCDNLTEFYCNATTPPEITTSTFYRENRRVEIIPDYNLYIPTGCSSKYGDTIWKDYFENIREMD